MDENDGLTIANEQLGWGSDLYETGLMHQMYGWPEFWMRVKGFGGAKPWVEDLEVHLRTFLSLQPVQELVAVLRPTLVQHKLLHSQPVLNAFNATVPLNSFAALRTFAAAQPD